jgi:RHS repeat-associated protein
LEIHDENGLATTGDGQNSPHVEHRYLYGAAVDEILASEDASHSVLWGLGDHEGTIRDIANSAGAVVNHRTYDSFGNVEEFVAGSTTPTTTGPLTDDFTFAYTGQSFDAAVGMYDYGYRWYDASVGRFASEDPSGFKAGDMNLYRYVGNNPWNATDPTGLRKECGGARSQSTEFLGVASNPWIFENVAGNTSFAVGSSPYSTTPYGSSAQRAELDKERAEEAEADARTRQFNRVNEMFSAIDRVNADPSLSRTERSYKAYKIAEGYGDHTTAAIYQTLVLMDPNQTQMQVRPALGFLGTIAAPFIDLGGSHLTATAMGQWSGANDQFRRTTLEVVTGHTHEDLVVGAVQFAQDTFTGTHSTDRQWILDHPGNWPFDIGVSVATDPWMYVGAGVSAVKGIRALTQAELLAPPALNKIRLPEAIQSPYQVHVNPITGVGPMAIDTSVFTSGDVTMAGGIRNSRQFWTQWCETYGHTLSDANKALILDEGLAPVVDGTWTRYFPEHEPFFDRILIHHHLDYGPLAVPMPEPVHVTQPGNGIWHQ